MTIIQTLKSAFQKLESKKINSAILDAEILLSFILKKPKEFLYLNPNKKINEVQQTKFQNLIKKRIQGQPIAYLIKHKEFFGLDFTVNKNVLIPRPDTEILVGQVLKSIDKIRQKFVIADIGTGSGSIVISLAKNLPGKKIKFYGIDICKKALSVAKQNAKKHNVFSQINFFQGNLLEPLKNKKIDLITANLPYLSEESHKNLSIEVKTEPTKALIAGKKIIEELNLYKKLFQQIVKFKLNPKLIFCEIHSYQKKSLEKIIKKFLPNAEITFHKDLNHQTRITEISNIQ